MIKTVAAGNSDRLKAGRKTMGYTSYGYLGLVDGKWILFATESDYYEYMT